MYFGLKLNKQDNTNNKNNSNNSNEKKITKGGCFIYLVYSLTRALTFFISQPPRPLLCHAPLPITRNLETLSHARERERERERERDRAGDGQ